MKTRDASPPGVGGNRPVVAPLALVEVDERVEVGERVGRLGSRTISPAASARRILRRISWRAFLSSVDEVVLEVDASAGSVTTGQTSSRSRFDRPAVARSRRRPNAVGERVGRRIAAAQAAQVDDVPGLRVVGSSASGVGREVIDEGVGDRRQVGRGGEDRRVVGVVGGAEEDRLGGRRDRRQVAAASPWRILDAVSASPGSTSWRCISGTIATGSPASGRRPAGRGRTTSVWSWALPPYASHHARWNAQRENGVAHGLRAARASQVVARDVVERAAARRAGQGRTGPHRRVVGLPGVRRARTGRLRVGSVGGHGRRIAPGPPNRLRTQRSAGRVTAVRGLVDRGIQSPGGMERRRRTASMAARTIATVVAPGTGVASATAASGVATGSTIEA